MAATPDLYRPTIKPPAVTPASSGSASAFPRPRLSDPSLPAAMQVPSFAQKVGQGVPGAILKGLGALPIARDMGAAVGVADKGVPVIKDVAYGLANPNATTARQEPAPLARPDFSDVVGGSSTVATPAATPLVRPTAANADSNPTNRVLGTFTGKNGTQTISESSAAALADKLPAASGPVAGDGRGNFAFAAGGASTVSAAPAVARPVYAPPSGGGAQGAVIGSDGVGDANSERLAALSQLNSQLQAIGPLNSRGKRQFASELMQQSTALTQQAGTLAGAAANSQLDASTRANIVNANEQGANFRTGAEQQGANYRVDADQLGQTFRLFNKPEYQADAAGTVNQVANGVARPVKDVAGTPLRTVTAQQEKAAERRQTVLKSFGDRAAENVPVGRQASYAEIQTARAQAAMTNGFKVIVDANGERMVNIDGEWVPL